MRDLLYITPPDGIVNGESQQRDTPLHGYFAIKTAKRGLERALWIRSHEDQDCCFWSFYLDGFLMAGPNLDWRVAAGFLGKSAFVLGRRLTATEYNRLIKIRASDKERGIDLSAAVDLNSVEIPSFGVKK